jgi:hypothetical protein
MLKENKSKDEVLGAKRKKPNNLRNWEDGLLEIYRISCPPPRFHVMHLLVFFFKSGLTSQARTALMGCALCRSRGTFLISDLAGLAEPIKMERSPWGLLGGARRFQGENHTEVRIGLSSPGSDKAKHRIQTSQPYGYGVGGGMSIALDGADPPGLFEELRTAICADPTEGSYHCAYGTVSQVVDIM